ncbi:MAG: lactate racemase domain-containing protein [Planctomycetales bacterium]
MSADAPILTPAQVRAWIRSHLPIDDFLNQRVLLIVPDGTRTAPLPLLFDAVYQRLRAVASQFDVLIALGTHPPMNERQMCRLLGIAEQERNKLFAQVGLFNHEWDDPEGLLHLGRLTAEETSALSGGLLAENVPVTINSRITDYDVLLVLGPVFPHEVVGFSGGNKYFFPGIAGAEILNFFHWLGALITNAAIIGVKQTPVRQVVDRAAALIPVTRKCLAFVVSPQAEIHGMFYGTPEAAWNEAADLSAQTHITRVPRPFRQVLSCAPPMYDELWVAGKCMYKLEPVVADGGELIIYAPHLTEISITHGAMIRQVGYHCRDYFTNQPGRFEHIPRGVLAHSTHVRGQGTYLAGIEQCRIQVTLATGIPEAVCREINLGYRDPASIDVEAFADREEEGVLLVRKAGEMLYRLE